MASWLKRLRSSHDCKSRLAKGYGMTELGSAAVYAGDAGCNKVGSIGIPLVKNNCKVVTPGTSDELTYNEIGEVCISSPSAMLGYYHNESATQEVLKLHEDGELWVHTQDLGYIDDDGAIFLVGRLKRMIIRPDGHNVFPSRIENVILQFSGVKDCVVIGTKNPKGKNGKIPTALLVLDDGLQVTSDKLINELTAFCKEKLPERDMALEYIVIDKLPMTLGGKVDYRKAEDMAETELRERRA